MSEKLLAEDVEANLGKRLRSARPLGGGCIGEVYQAELEDGTPLVAKVDRDGESHLDREAYMLRYLREESDLPVPEVLHGSRTLLLMEFIEGSSDFTDGAERHAAESLAQLHHISADAYGHERDTLIGSLGQPNPWTESWADFFRDRRLLYMAKAAYDAGRISSGDLGRIEALAERLDELIGDPSPPGLIHGDVWRGNVLAKGDRITAFLDPALYHADPEIELSFISLFDSFGDAFFGRYEELCGIRPGFFASRRHLYALYPLLTHAYYFGGGYPGSVRSNLERLGF